MRALIAALGLVGLGCASAPKPVASRWPECTSFVEYDAQVRAELARVEALPPGNAMALERSDLIVARRACARQVLGRLVAQRRTEGLEAVRREVAALDATYTGNEVRILALDAPGYGEELNALLLELGSPGGSREPPPRPRVAEVSEPIAPQPPAPPRVCDFGEGCARLECVVAAAPDELADAARGCFAFLKTLPPAVEAENLAEVLRFLPQGAVAQRAEAQASLQRLHDSLWPLIREASAKGHHGRAAQLARPFAALPAGWAMSERLRERAREHHLQRAADLAATPEAAWVHHALASEFGGPAPPALGGRGEWRLELDCDEKTPALLPLPPGVGATLKVQCQRPSGQPPSEPRGMPWYPYDGALTVRCASWEQTYPVRVSAGQSWVFEDEVAKQTRRAVADCVGRFNLEEERACAELPKLQPVAVLTRAVGYARMTHRWVKCFADWLREHEGLLQPPEPPPSVLDALEAQEPEGPGGAEGE